MFQPYKSKRAFEQIADEIKATIFDHKLKSGDRLPSEREMAEQFQAGRMTVREALRTLEISGFIQIKKGSEGGAFVGNYNPEALSSLVMDNFQLEGITPDEILDTRLGLESATVACAIKNATKNDFTLMEQNIEEAEEITDRGGPVKRFHELAIEYHILLAEASHVLPLTMFVRTLSHWSRRKPLRWEPTRAEQAWMTRSHRRIFESIKKKDVTLARQLIQEDIEKMRYLYGEWNRQSLT
ncbi:MAG: FadR family transcriptional regulator [Deltaproteobacteria bacterium]|nr:FadR family transcriptional regulator [Deltaproteobacteria bacterium]